MTLFTQASQLLALGSITVDEKTRLDGFVTPEGAENMSWGDAQFINTLWEKHFGSKHRTLVEAGMGER